MHCFYNFSISCEGMSQEDTDARLIWWDRARADWYAAPRSSERPETILIQVDRIPRPCAVILAPHPHGTTHRTMCRVAEILSNYMREFGIRDPHGCTYASMERYRDADGLEAVDYSGGFVNIEAGRYHAVSAIHSLVHAQELDARARSCDPDTDD